MCSCPEEFVIIKQGRTSCKRCSGVSRHVHHTEAMMLDEILTIRDRWHGAQGTTKNEKGMRMELDEVLKRYAGIRAKFSVCGNKVVVEVV